MSHCWHEEIDDETGICKACGAKAAIKLKGMPKYSVGRKTSVDMREVPLETTPEKETRPAMSNSDELREDWVARFNETIGTWPELSQDHKNALVNFIHYEIRTALLAKSDATPAPSQRPKNE